MTESVAEEIRTLQSLVWSERDPDGRGFASLADAHRRAGEPRKAFEILNEGLLRLPGFASGHVVAARLYVEQGLFAEGELAARRALELDPDNVSAMASLVKALEGAGRPDGAAEARATLAALEPEILAEEGLEPDDDGVLDVMELEPSTDDEDVLDIVLLEPDDDGDLVLDVRTLAPDAATPPGRSEPDLPEEELVLGPDALGPDAEGVLGGPILDMAALRLDTADAEAAYEEAAYEEAVLDIAALQPESVDDDMVIEVAILEPDVPDEELVLEVSALEPDLPEDDLVLEVSALEPDLPEDDLVLEVAALEPGAASESAVPDPAPAARDGGGGAPRIYTRTLGELYAKQGFTDRAAEVFRHLLAGNPGDAELAARLEELERATPVPPPYVAPAPAAEAQPRPERDEELEAIARDLTMNRDVHPEVDSPFAWADEAEEEDHASDDAPTVREYFAGLLSWRTGREA